jgi:hypothetical protein
VAIHLERAGGRAAFLALLDRARSDAAAQRLVREEITASGALRMAALAAAVHLERGRCALGRTAAAEPGRARLAALLDSISPGAGRRQTRQDPIHEEAT